MAKRKATKKKNRRSAARTTKRTVKDSVFRYLFSLSEYRVLLVKDLHPEDTDLRAEDVAEITLVPLLTDGRANDLGLKVRGRLIILVEAQSIFTLNIALRLLIYVAQSYEQEIAERELNVYGTKAVTLPKPEFYVVYTGTDDVPDEICLSDLFEKAETAESAESTGSTNTLELTVKVLRGGEPGSITQQYVRFCQIADEQRALYGYSLKTIRETIKICKREGILADFLAQHEKEVVDIMCPIYDAAHQRKLDIRDAREEGREEGERIGYQNGERVGYQNGERIGYQNGERNGREEGRMEMLFTNIQSMAQAFGKTVAECMDILSVKPEDRAILNQRFAAL